MKDKEVQDAQDYIREIAEPGSYLESIADLIEELYAVAYTGAREEPCLTEKQKLQQKLAAQTMLSRAERWAANSYKRA